MIQNPRKNMCSFSMSLKDNLSRKKGFKAIQSRTLRLEKDCVKYYLINYKLLMNNGKKTYWQLQIETISYFDKNEKIHFLIKKCFLTNIFRCFTSFLYLSLSPSHQSVSYLPSYPIFLLNKSKSKSKSKKQTNVLGKVTYLLLLFSHSWNVIWN